MISEKIKRLRHETGKSQKQMAEELNVSQQSYSNWEQGKSMPSPDNILKIANFFQVPPAYLMGWEEDQELDKVQVLVVKLKDNTLKRSIKWYCLGDETTPQYILIGVPFEVDHQKSYYCRVGSFYYSLLWVYDEKYVLHCAYPKKYADMNQFPFDESSNVKNTEMDFFIYTGSDEKNNVLDDLASIVKERIKETGTVNDSLLTDMISALDNLE